MNYCNATVHFLFCSLISRILFIGANSHPIYYPRNSIEKGKIVIKPVFFFLLLLNKDIDQGEKKNRTIKKSNISKSKKSRYKLSKKSFLPTELSMLVVCMILAHSQQKHFHKGAIQGLLISKAKDMIIILDGPGVWGEKRTKN